MPRVIDRWDLDQWVDSDEEDEWLVGEYGRRMMSGRTSSKDWAQRMHSLASKIQVRARNGYPHIGPTMAPLRS